MEGDANLEELLKNTERTVDPQEVDWSRIIPLDFKVVSIKQTVYVDELDENRKAFSVKKVIDRTEELGPVYEELWKEKHSK